jgi:hypothetical protein
MRTFAQKRKSIQQTDSARSAKPGRALFGQNPDVHSILHLQRTIGHQVVQWLPQAEPDCLEACSSNQETTRSGHGSRQMPVQTESPVSLQAKLTVSPPGDIHEQEADRVAEQVMGMPDPQNVSPQNGDGRLQRRCSACEKEDEEKHDKLERRELSGASAPAPTAAPGIVHNVLNSPGQPLDARTRAFFEPRFGHDFGHVRIHADGLAEESARAVDAQAYTVKHHVVFGPGQCSPSTLPGWKLLAHELTHVVQQATASNQLQPADIASSLVRNNVLQRKPDKPTQAERRREQQLEELARDPGEAHQVWKRLSQMERIAVAERMRRRYGGPFAQQFLDTAEKGKPQIETQNYQPGSGPTPEQLIARGYRRGWSVLGNAGVEVEYWVHPSGRRIQRDISTWKPGAAEPEKSPKTEVKKPPTKKPPIVDKPPLNEKQLKALKLLDQMQEANNKLQDLVDSDPIPWEKVRCEYWHFQDADKELRQLSVGPDNPDPNFPSFSYMDDVDPDFSEEFYEANNEYQELADRFRDLDPNFASGPVECGPGD